VALSPGPVTSGESRDPAADGGIGGAASVATASLTRLRVLCEPPFDLEVVVRAGARALVLRGELDLLTRAHVGRALDEARARGESVRLLDLRELDFMDCAGLDVVLAAAWGARADGGELTVVIGAGHGRRLFELLDVSELRLVDAGAGDRAG
jgi:anti-anti-sigma factor